MNSNQRPTTITAAAFVADGYAEKIARGECKVFDVFPTETVEVKGIYKVGHHMEVFYTDIPDDPCWIPSRTELTVEWLPQPEPLLPQTVNTIRYGTLQFEQLSRDDAEAEIKRLTAEVARLTSERDALREFVEQPIQAYPHDKPVKSKFDDLEGYFAELGCWHDAEAARRFLARLDGKEPITNDDDGTSLPF